MGSVSSRGTKPKSRICMEMEQASKKADEVNRSIRVLQVNFHYAKIATAIICRRFDKADLHFTILQEPWLDGRRTACLKKNVLAQLYNNKINCVLISVLCTADIVAVLLTTPTEDETKS